MILDFLRKRNRGARTFRVHGFKVHVADLPGAAIAPTVIHELKRDAYGFARIPFEPGDVVVDLGGHIGLVSIYLAKRYPFLTVRAFEPCPPNYQAFVENLKLNDVMNVTVDNVAITSDRRNLDLIVNLENSGGATANLADMRLPKHENFTVPSITLDDVFERYGIGRCKLLKIDCEGSEHEILHTTKVLDRVDWLSGEFHLNRHLQEQGHSIEGLVSHLQTSIPADRIWYESCHMAE